MVIVRDLREADAPAVRDMMQRLAQQRRESSHHLVLKQEYSRFFGAYLQSLLKNPDSVIKVAEADGRVVGYAIATRSRAPEFYKFSKVAHLSDVFVDEAHRKQGIAHQLLQALEGWARKSGLQALEVDVFPEHEQEIRSLEGLGFTRYRIKYLRPLSGATATGNAR
jgi:GNAT superfamily N-acetyltransferase